MSEKKNYSDWILEEHDKHFCPKVGQVRQVSLDEFLLPKWFRDKTYNFPFLSFIFTILLLWGIIYMASTIHDTGYEQGRRDAQSEKVKKNGN